ncbi:hypothetical protein GBK02_09180 [Dechloromonas sp. TW-R-39-2]|uniref:hypothetical protein n=1 Tax=Dechloromonas sp. TW-R-39-2 TaxID=2654218 RepID=UPI00193D9AD0|nr:hypothetical protein [Dechloromonas sp. TW-R-39-2]QRM19562.1 hypothetical protein GBK02_09180 [Dechloromonas sp. TW-R-39-2]
MSIWPDFMPVSCLDGYELKRKSSTARTPMEAGPARVRRRFTRVPTHIPQRWILDQKQFGYFEWWFDNSVDEGAGWFTAPQKNGTGMVTVQCRFVDSEQGPYKAKPLSNGLWEVTAELEVDAMPRGQLTDFWPDDEPTLVLDFLAQIYEVAG